MIKNPSLLATYKSACSSRSRFSQTLHCTVDKTSTYLPYGHLLCMTVPAMTNQDSTVWAACIEGDIRHDYSDKLKVIQNL